MTSLYMEGRKAQINRQKCIGCGKCVARCHKQAPIGYTAIHRKL